MSLNKRFTGDLVITSIDSGDSVTLHSAGGVTLNTTASAVPVIIDGDLTVTGTSTSVQSTDTEIVDNSIVLNSGEVGAGVTAGTAGIEIDRGSELPALLYFQESDDTWYLDNGDGSPSSIVTDTGFIVNIVEDTTPQLGGNLDVNGFSITSATNGDIVVVADGTGLVKIDQDLSLLEQGTDETALAGYNKLYAKTPAEGGTGLFVSNTTIGVDELVSKKKAIVYGLVL